MKERVMFIPRYLKPVCVKWKGTASCLICIAKSLMGKHSLLTPAATTTTSEQLKEAQLQLQTGAGTKDILDLSHVKTGTIWNEID